MGANKRLQYAACSIASLSSRFRTGQRQPVDARVSARLQALPVAVEPPSARSPVCKAGEGSAGVDGCMCGDDAARVL